MSEKKNGEFGFGSRSDDNNNELERWLLLPFYTSTGRPLNRFTVGIENLAIAQDPAAVVSNPIYRQPIVDYNRGLLSEDEARQDLTRAVLNSIVNPVRRYNLLHSLLSGAIDYWAKRVEGTGVGSETAFTGYSRLSSFREELELLEKMHKLGDP